MSLHGLKIAKEFGHALPAFSSQAEAAAYLFDKRDERIHRIAELGAASRVFVANFTPESLKGLESWYFSLCDTDGFETLGISRQEFEGCMASYFGEVAVRNCPDTQWEVREFEFERGKFEIGVRRSLLHFMLSWFTDHYKKPNNKKRQKIYTTFKQMFAA